MIAGSLELQMFANLARLQSDMSEAKKLVRETSETLEKALGAIGVGFGAHELLEKVNSVTEGMQKLRDASEKTGDSVESLSKLQFFAGASGSSFEGISNALAKLAKAESGSGLESQKASQAFRFLGLSAKDAAGNLKAPADLFDEISKSLIGYRDGAGKAAIAQAIFSKGGEAMLPTLKKMAEIGEIEATTTTAQAAAAEEYGMQLARLNQQKQIVWNTLVTGLLPSMTTFVETLIKAQKETGGLRDNVSRIAADHTLENWADSAGLGIAALVDVMRTLSKTLSEIEEPLERYFRASQAGWAALSIVFGPGKWAEKEAALDALRKESAEINEELKKRAASGSFWTLKLNTDMSDALKKGIAERRALEAKNDLGARGGRGARPGEGGEGGKALNFMLTDPAAGKALIGAQTSALNKASSSAMADVARQMSEIDKIFAEIENKRKILAALSTEFDKENRARSTAMDVMPATTRALITDLQAVADRANAARESAQHLFDTGAMSAEIFHSTLAKITEEELKQDDAVRGLNQRQIDLNASWEYGADKALTTYLDSIRDVSAQSEQLFTHGLQGMEDAVVKFTETGKFSFASMAQSFMSDMIRLEVRAEETKLFDYLKGSGGGSSIFDLAASLFPGGTQAPAPVVDAVAKAVPQFASGTPYVQRDGLAYIHQGERIVPASENRAGGGHSVTVNFYGDQKAPDVRRAGGQVAREVLAVIGTAQRYK